MADLRRKWSTIPKGSASLAHAHESSTNRSLGYRWRRGCRRGTRVGGGLGDGVRLGVAMGIALGIGEAVGVGDCSGVGLEG